MGETIPPWHGPVVVHADDGGSRLRRYIGKRLKTIGCKSQRPEYRRKVILSKNFDMMLVWPPDFLRPIFAKKKKRKRL